MPSLEAIAAYVLRNGFALNIEIKPTPGQELETGRVVAREAAWLWATSRVAPVAPPLPELVPPRGAARRARDRARTARALLLDTLWTGWFDVARALDVVACVTNHKIMDESCTRSCRPPACARWSIR